MIVLSLRRFQVFIAVTIGIMALFGIGIGVWNLKSEQDHSKVDRSNAMQVTRSVSTEQAMPVVSADFFTEYRLERDKMRSERFDILRDSIKNASNDDLRQKAQESVLKMVQDKQRESEMESLIKARGFSDALVFCRDNSVNAIIKAPQLSKEEVIQVADVISRVAGIKPEDITISAKP